MAKAQPGPRAEWTQIQDLKPNKPSAIRPIKQKWAVVIGAAKFKESRLNDASQKMDAAAQEFYQYLISPHGGRVPESHVKLLLNNQATRQNIMAALGEPWLGSTAGQDDLVVVFIATNGFPTTDGGTYLSAYDCALDNVYATCLSMQTLMETLKANVHANRILLVLESCYSGAAELTSGAKALYCGYSIDLDKVAIGKGYIILSSSQPNEITWGDAFSHNLIKSLRSQDGLITLSEAFQLAKKDTIMETSQGSESGHKQTPIMKSSWTGNDLVIGTPPLDKVSALPQGVADFLSAESYYLKASNFVSSGNFDSAIAEYKNAIAMEPKYADALADYGALLSMQGDFTKAADLYRQAIAASPTDALFHANYAVILHKLRQDDQSLAELELAYRLNPKNRTVLTALSTHELAAKNTNRAVELLQQAVELFPNASTLHERYSYALAQLGDLPLALAQAQEAVRLDSHSASAKLNLGSTFLLNGQTDSALSTYREVVRLAPDNPDAHYLLGETLAQLGDKSGAEIELNKFLQLCSENDPRKLQIQTKLDLLH